MTIGWFGIMMRAIPSDDHRIARFQSRFDDPAIAVRLDPIANRDRPRRRDVLAVLVLCGDVDKLALRSFEHSRCGTAMAFCRIAPARRTRTNWPGRSPPSAFGNSARIRTYPSPD
jgi:hypothetical protein